MADEAEWFGARVEGSSGQGFESPEGGQGEDGDGGGDYPSGDGGVTAYPYGGRSVLAEPRAS